MDIGYVDCVALRGHYYILILVYHAVCFILTYLMFALSGADIIQSLQAFILDSVII